MPGISASPSSARLTVAAKQTAESTHDLADLLELLRGEVRKLVLVLDDANVNDEDVLR